MAKRFEGQVAIVTGGADGLGKGICQRLSSEGAAVAIFDFNEAKMAETAEELRKGGAKCVTQKVDVANEQAVKAAIDAVVAELGRLDIMINCAGIVGESE